MTSRGPVENGDRSRWEKKGMDKFVIWILSDGIHMDGQLLYASTSAKVRNVCEFMQIPVARR